MVLKCSDAVRILHEPYEFSRIQEKILDPATRTDLVFVNLYTKLSES